MLIYPLSATANNSCDPYKLYLYAQGSGIPVVSVSCGDGEIHIQVSRDLTTTESETLGYLIAAHDGKKIPSATTYAVATLITKVVEFTNEDWPSSINDENGLVGVLVSRPDFFNNLSNIIGQILGASLVTAGTNGELPQIRIVQRNLNTQEESVILGPVNITSGPSFKLLNIISSAGVFGSGYLELFIQARRNNAELFKLRGVTGAVIGLV